MTPDEMKVLARVANRNAVEESPIVVDESRLIAPVDVPNDSGNFEERLDKLEVLQQDGINRVNQLESQLGQVLGANDSPVKVLASVVAQTRADVAELKSVRDVMRLNPADVLSDVIKPIKITSAVELLDADFADAFSTNGLKLNGEPVNTKTKVIRSFKDIGTRPKNLLNLDNAGISNNVLSKISGNANLINGGFSLTSNSGLRIIDLTNKDFEINSDIPKINATAVSTNKINNVSGVIDKFDWISGSGLKGSKTISLPSNGFYNGIYQNTASMPTSAPQVGSHYILVQDSSDFRFYIYKWNGSAYVIVSATSTEFTESAIISGASVDVLFPGSGTYMGLKTNPTGFYYIDPSPLNGSNILVENRNTAPSGGVRPLFIVQCTPIDSSIISVNTQQTATLLKPTADQFYRLQGFDKYVKVNVSTGLVNASVTSGSTLYFDDNNVLYSQATGATANRIRLDNNSWLFNTISRKFICNSSTVQGPVPAGYYNYQGKLVKMDGQGNVVFDSTKGEVVAYKFKNNKNYTLTVPSLTAVSSVTDFFPDLAPQTVLTDLYISEDLFVRNESGNAIKTLEGLYYAKGNIAFTRANLLYSINADGKCSLYSGLAYLEIEPENATYGLRVWYTATAGVLAPLSSNNYLNTANNRVFTTGTVAPTGASVNYTADFTTAVEAVALGNLAAITRKNRNGLLEAPISLSDLSRFSSGEMYNIKQYQALGLISGKTTMSDVAALGGFEIMSSVETTYNAKYIRVVSGVNYEIVYVNTSNAVATATKNNSVLSGNLLLQIGSNLFNVDNSKDNLLVKVTSGFVFADESDPVDLRSINSEGIMSNPLSLTADCLHFAWADADGVSKMYWADVANNNRLQKVASNWGYEYSARNGETSYSNLVLLIKKPVNSTNGNDEEDTSNDTSSYTMHILDIANGTYSPLPVPDSNNNNSKGYKFTNASFNANEFAGPATSGAITYWHRDASNNKPHINRVISVTSGGSTLKYNTSNMGVRDTAVLAINGEYSTDLSNALFRGVDNQWSKIDLTVRSKYYIDYDGNLAQTGPQFGDRALIVPNNYFVVFADNNNRSRYFSNGRMVAVTPGTLVAVSSSKPAQHPDHEHNGLKMWGKDATGMFNRWLNMESQQARESNNANVGQVVDIIDEETNTFVDGNVVNTVAARAISAPYHATALLTDATQAGYTGLVVGSLGVQGSTVRQVTAKSGNVLTWGDYAGGLVTGGTASTVSYVIYTNSGLKIARTDGTNGAFATTLGADGRLYGAADGYIYKQSGAHSSGVVSVAKLSRFADNTTALYTVSANLSGLKLVSKDDSEYTILSGASKILVVDGSVQNARAPRGTTVYTENGAKMRTGYSRAQYAANGLNADQVKSMATAITTIVLTGAQYIALGITLTAQQETDMSITNADARTSGLTNAQLKASGISFSPIQLAALKAASLEFTDAQLANAKVKDSWM
jgi:hypothetical protein